MIPLPVIGEPFRRIAIDIVGPLPRTRRGNGFILVVSDYATHYPEAVPLRNITAPKVAEVLIDLFSRHGVPEEIPDRPRDKLHISIVRRTREDHLRHLDEALKRLEDAGLTLKLKKCTFATEDCTYLGYRIGRGGVTPENSKVYTSCI